MSLSNCQVWASRRQLQRGGCVLLMPSPFAKCKAHQNPGIVGLIIGRPLLLLAYAVMHFAYWLEKGKWLHAAWSPTAAGPWTEWGPEARSPRSPISVLLFKGQEQPLSAVYRRLYKAPQ